jgi:transcriptional regulator with XRE-family HTH domain
MTQIEESFGQALRELRTRKSMSQETLGFEADLARNYISQLELGSKSPSLRTIFALCAALDTVPSDLIKEVERRVGHNERRVGHNK